MNLRMAILARMHQVCPLHKSFSVLNSCVASEAPHHLDTSCTVVILHCMPANLPKVVAILQTSKSLVYSMDETFVNLVPMGGASTFDVKGKKDIAVAGGDDMRGMTVSMTCKPTEEMLPLQIIFGGKTAR